MSDTILKRIDDFRSALRQSDLDDEAVSLALRTLDHIHEASQLATGDGYAPNSVTDVVIDELDSVLHRLREPIRSGSAEALVLWTRAALQAVRDLVSAHSEMLRRESPMFDRRIFRLLQDTQRDLMDSLYVLDSFAVRAKAQESLALAEAAATGAQQARDNAERASGEAGEAALSTHFATYATDELKLAGSFRLLAILLIGVAVALASLLLLVPEWRVHANDWTGFATKFALLAGLGSLSAYLARQAATHRRTGTWARSLELQLNSFPAFLDGVPEDGRTAAYLALSQRLLGPPPNKDGDTSQEQVPTVQLIELVTAAIKKS